MTEAEYKRFVQHQRNLCNAHINLKLDDLCEKVGFPATAWRRWHSEAIRARRIANIQKFTDGLRNAVLTANEMRTAMGLPPIEE